MPKGNWNEFKDPLARSKVNNPINTIPKKDQRVRIEKVRSGRKGKTVTLISGLEIPEEECRKLLKALKTSSGTGGTIKGGTLIELQGDQMEIALNYLKREGFHPKQSGN